MKKRSKLFIGLALFSMSLVSCGESDVNEAVNAKLHEIYDTAVANGETRSYDEWLDSIQSGGDKTPTITIGENGNWFINDVDTGVHAQGEPGKDGQDGKDGVDGKDGENGKDGVDGQNGENGKDGTSLLNGHGVPASNLGNNGDSYIDLDTWNYYVKENGKWILKGNIKADSIDENPQGLDFYLMDDGNYAVGVGNAMMLSTVEIPETYKDIPVTTIYAQSFFESYMIKELIIPTSITTICYGYFPANYKIFTYKATLEQFRDVEFIDSRIPQYDGVQLNCLDGVYLVDDLYDSLSISGNREGDYEIIDSTHYVGSYSYLYSYIYTEDFGRISKSIDASDVKFEFSEEEIVVLEKGSQDQPIFIYYKPGTVTIKATYQNFTKEFTITVLPLNEFDVVFEDVTVAYDGQSHCLNPVSGAPEGTKIRYEYYYTGGILSYDDVTRLNFVDVGEYKIKATLSSYGYKTLEVSATLKIYDPSKVGKLYVNGNYYDKMTTNNNETMWSYTGLVVNAGDTISFTVNDSPISLYLYNWGNLDEFNIAENQTDIFYDYFTIKEGGTINVYFDNSSSYYRLNFVSYDYSHYENPYSWSEAGHLYIHYLRNDNDYDNWAVWAWQYAPQSLNGSLWGANSDLIPSNMTPMTYGYMKNSQCGKEGDDPFIDDHGQIIDIDLTMEIYDARNGESSPLINNWDNLSNCSFGYLIVDQRSMSGSSQWISEGGYERYISNLDNILYEGKNTCIHVYIVQGNTHTTINSYSVQS